MSGNKAWVLIPPPPFFLSYKVSFFSGFRGGSVVKNPLPAIAGNASLILGSGRSPGEGNGNPLEYSYLGNPMDKGAWQTPVHGIAEVSDTTYWLNNNELHM